MQFIRSLRFACLTLAPLPGLWITLNATAAAQTSSADKSLLVYIGTYTGAKSQGIYVARFDPASGKLGAPTLAAEAINPTFLALHPNRRWLYAANETENFGGQRTGAISAFTIDAQTGKLTLLNQQPSRGGGPCHVAVDKSGRCVLAANYGGGSVASFRVGSDGRLSEPVAAIQHHGSSVNRQRQAGPHAHHILPDPTNRFVLACDLGLDQVLVYGFKPAEGALSPNDPPAAALKPGSGPRHLVFHPNGRFVYVINELSSTLTTFSYKPRSGILSDVQTVSTLPPDFKGNNSCAEVQAHPSGKFVYGSNRGDDSIATFAVDADTGAARYVSRESTQGKTPRHFALDPAGKWLLAENQGSDNIVVFRVDADTGGLSATGQSIAVGAPVCAVFVEPK